jgi:hypothetical protein
VPQPVNQPINDAENTNASAREFMRAIFRLYE